MFLFIIKLLKLFTSSYYCFKCEVWLTDLRISTYIYRKIRLCWRFEVRSPTSANVLHLNSWRGQLYVCIFNVYTLIYIFCDYAAYLQVICFEQQISMTLFCGYKSADWVAYHDYLQFNLAYTNNYKGPYCCVI